MSRPLNIDLKKHLYHFATAFLLSSGMALCVYGAVFPLHIAAPIWGISALICLSFEGLSLLKGKSRWAFPLLFLLALLLLGLLGRGPGYTLLQLAKAGYLSLRGLPDAVLPYADAARFALCAFFSVLGCLMAWDASFPLSCFCVVTTAGLAMIFSGSEKLLLYALPSFAGLVMVLGGQDEKRLSTLLIAGGAVAAAFLLLPGNPKTVQPLEKAATDVRQFLEDYVFFTEYRASFSLATEGYQPLEDRLGGPADPADRPVMAVETDETLLLRGKTYDAYTGLNWQDTLSARRYLYISPRYEALRSERFALKKPLEGASLFREKTIGVRILSPGTTTLFAPAFTRRMQMENERMVLYFNTAAELFLTRNLEADDAYRLTYLSIDPDSEKTRQAVSACAAAADPFYATAQDEYLALPSHIQQEVFDIAQQAMGSAQTPYEKALAIRDYLRAHYRYALDVKTPPDQVDFAAWFLLGEKEGYCTYFATAMTVLCRIAGIPARYVTGYLAVPDENGVAKVTGESAHAWTEIYLNGLGWLEMDATPRGDNTREKDGGNDGEDGSGPNPPSSTPSPSPSPTPTPESTPTPPPTSAPSDQPTNKPSDRPTPQPDPTPDNPPDREQPPFPWLPLLMLILLALLICLRFLFTEPVRRAARKPAMAPHILMRAILGLLTLRKIRRLPQETLQSFAARADNALAGKGLPVLKPLMEQYSALLYGRHEADAAAFRDAYLQYRAAAALPGRAKRALLRMLGRE